MNVDFIPQWNLDPCLHDFNSIFLSGSSVRSRMKNGMNSIRNELKLNRDSCNKYNLFFSRLNRRNQFDPDCNLIRIHVNTLLDNLNMAVTASSDGLLEPSLWKTLDHSMKSKRAIVYAFMNIVFFVFLKKTESKNRFETNDLESNDETEEKRYVPPAGTCKLHLFIFQIDLKQWQSQPDIWSCKCKFSVFIDRIRNQFLKKWIVI